MPFLYYLQHVDILFYCLRKKDKYDPDVYIKFTTINYLFDLKIKALYMKFIEQNRDSLILKPEHDIAHYILGDSMLCNSMAHSRSRFISHKCCI